jgi:hypothetical protein
MQSIQSGRTRCHVCGFTEIRIDEAVDRELVVLAECPRCEHRWTNPPAVSRDPMRAVSFAGSRREVASAA